MSNRIKGKKTQKLNQFSFQNDTDHLSTAEFGHMTYHLAQGHSKSGH